MQYLIIGNSAAGMAAASAIRKGDTRARILILSDESHPPYHRPLIPDLIGNGIGHDLLLRDSASFPHGLEIRLGERVETIDCDKQDVHLARGASLDYDRLLLATGSSAARLSVPGLDGPEVHVLRTIDDAMAVKNHAEKASKAIIIGGGRVGLKAALALRKRGLEVTVVEQGDRLVPLQFDSTAAEIVGIAVEDLGIRVVLGTTVREVEKESGRVKNVLTTYGERIPVELVLVAVGIRPNADLARDAGLEVQEGILVDRFLRTNAPNVYAAGDVVETTDIITGRSIIPGTWTAASEMGRAAGSNMAGGNVMYAGGLLVQNSVVLAGISTVSVGQIDPPAEDRYQIHMDRWGDDYRKLVFKDNRLVGALMIGSIEGAGIYTSLIKRQIDVGRFREHLLVRRPTYAPWLRHDTTTFLHT